MSKTKRQAKVVHVGDRSFVVEVVRKWVAPKGGVPIITMPNVPRPLHGESMQPRTILSSSEWQKMSRLCKFKANYTCEVSGEQPELKRDIHNHELFSYDYDKHEAVFERCVCLSRKVHIYGIHTGRALTMYKRNDPTVTKRILLDGAENAFRLVSDYNKANPHKKPLRLFATFLDYAKEPTLQKEMFDLIDKYQIEFYTVPEPPKRGSWADWHIVFNGKTYYTKFKNYADWHKKMEVVDKNEREIKNNPFKGETFTELDNILNTK